MTPKEIEIDRKIEYNHRMAKSMVRIGFTVFALIGIIALQFVINHYSAKPQIKPVVDTDTLYIYYRGEQGHISFHKPLEISTLDWNYTFENHSRIPDKLKDNGSNNSRGTRNRY